MAKHDMPEPADRDGKTYPGSKDGARLKAAGKIKSEGKAPKDPKHAKD